MTPDATTEKIRDKNKSRYNWRQAVRSNPFMIKKAPSGGKSRQQITLILVLKVKYICMILIIQGETF